MKTTQITVKMVHFPGTGLSPRPYDAYDAVCERYYWSYANNLPTSLRIRREAMAELLLQFGSNDLDGDYTHGRNIAKHYRVVQG